MVETEAEVYGPKSRSTRTPWTEADVHWFNFESRLRIGRFPLHSPPYTPTRRYAYAKFSSGNRQILTCLLELYQCADGLELLNMCAKMVIMTLNLFYRLDLFRLSNLLPPTPGYVH